MIYKEVKLNLENVGRKYKKTVDKNCRDLLMVHLRTERILAITYNKFNGKKIGSVRVLKKINDNGYIVDLL